MIGPSDLGERLNALWKAMAEHLGEKDQNTLRSYELEEIVVSTKSLASLQSVLELLWVLWESSYYVRLCSLASIGRSVLAQLLVIHQ
jgi:hypothetical protein